MSVRRDCRDLRSVQVRVLPLCDIVSPGSKSCRFWSSTFRLYDLETVASEKCGIYVGFGRLSDPVSVDLIIYRSCDGSVSKVVILCRFLSVI